MCSLGYSDFTNLMGFTSKKLPYIILNNVYLKSFFKELAISCEFVLKDLKIDSLCTQGPQNLFFLLMSIQKTQDFTLVSNPFK
jgi:hypothetical protein